MDVAQVVRRYERRGDIDADRGMAALADAVDRDVNYYEHLPLLRESGSYTKSVGVRRLSIALAEALDATLSTADRRIGSARENRAVVHLVGG